MRFYRDWYRPDLMSVIVVGDVDRAAVARMITQHFQSLTNPSPERPRPAFDVPEHPGTRYAVVTDKETTATAVQVSNLRPARNQGSVGGYRDIMLDQLFSRHARCAARRAQPEPESAIPRSRGRSVALSGAEDDGTRPLFRHSCRMTA